VSRRETNVRLRDPITVRSTSSGLLTYYYYSFGFFWIIFYPFPIIKLSPFYLITSLVPTCLVHNCETSRRIFYSHLLSLLSQDQIPFDPHKRIVLLRHDTKVAGYPRCWKTLELVSRNYWWPQMSRYIGQYISTCDLCLRTKPIRQALVGELHPLRILDS